MHVLPRNEAHRLAFGARRGEVWGRDPQAYLKKLHCSSGIKHSMARLAMTETEGVLAEGVSCKLDKRVWRMPESSGLVAPYRAILRWYRCDTPIARYFLSHPSNPPTACDTPVGALFYTDISVRYPTLQHIARYSCDTPGKQAHKCFTILSLKASRVMKSIAAGPLSPAENVCSKLQNLILCSSTGCHLGAEKAHKQLSHIKLVKTPWVARCPWDTRPGVPAKMLFFCPFFYSK